MSPSFSITIDVIFSEIPGVAHFQVTSDSPFELEPHEMVEILEETAKYIKEHPTEYSD